MRLPAPSYLVETVLASAAVVLGVVVAWPDPPPRPKPVAAAPAPSAPAPRPNPPPAAVQADAAMAEFRRKRVAVWREEVARDPYPLRYDRVRAADVRATHLMAFRAGTVGAFDQTPGRDGAWADLARAAFDLRARELAYHHLTGVVPPRHTEAGRAAVAGAVAAGCDDPLIVYWHRLDAARRGPAPDPAGLRAAAERVYASPYPAARRAHAAFNWLQAVAILDPDGPEQADRPEWETRFLDLLADAAGEQTLTTDEEVIDLAVRWEDYRLAQRRPREQALSELDRHLRRGGARPYLRHTVRGAGQIRLAWDARGTGYADTVTEERWEVFNARLRDARDALAAACEADPDGFTAPTHMLTVCMGMSLPREEMEDAFRLALAANPDNRRACFAKLEILNPKWQGSRDGLDYTKFAWALALYEGGGPYAAAVLAHLVSVTPPFGPVYEAQRQAITEYYSAPDTWVILSSAADRVLETDPDDDFTLNLIARVAVLARQPEAARRYFARIGDRFSPQVFRDRDEYDRFRRGSDPAATP